MLEDRSADTREAAANTIWNLAFLEDGRQKIAENKDCLKLLESLTQCSESHVADAAKGALWVITQGQAKQVEREVEAEGMQGERDFLRQKNCKIQRSDLVDICWIDVF